MYFKLDTRRGINLNVTLGSSELKSVSGLLAKLLSCQTIHPKCNKVEEFLKHRVCCRNPQEWTDFQAIYRWHTHLSANASLVSSRSQLVCFCNRPASPTCSVCITWNAHVNAKPVPFSESGLIRSYRISEFLWSLQSFGYRWAAKKTRKKQEKPSTWHHLCDSIKASLLSPLYVAWNSAEPVNVTSALRNNEAQCDETGVTSGSGR